MDEHALFLHKFMLNCKDYKKDQRRLFTQLLNVYQKYYPEQEDFYLIVLKPDNDFVIKKNGTSLNL